MGWTNFHPSQEESSKITTQATGATNWRRGEVKYKKNEAFVDVVETVGSGVAARSFNETVALVYAIFTDFVVVIPIRVRFIWSGIVAQRARWEQAFSEDGGITWETNWVMDFKRAR